MAYKRIYLIKRNHIVVAAEPTIRAIREALIRIAIVGEGNQFPTFSTFARRLRLYTHINFETTLGNKYEIIEMKNSRYKRSKLQS